jgi:hypothetical protein
MPTKKGALQVLIGLLPAKKADVVKMKVVGVSSIFWSDCCIYV